MNRHDGWLNAGWIKRPRAERSSMRLADVSFPRNCEPSPPSIRDADCHAVGIPAAALCVRPSGMPHHVPQKLRSAFWWIAVAEAALLTSTSLALAVSSSRVTLFVVRHCFKRARLFLFKHFDYRVLPYASSVHLVIVSTSFDSQCITELESDKHFLLHL